MNSERPTFSIVVPSFNQGRYLRATLRSILDQSIEDLQLIVVDGGSTDESPAIIREFAAHIDWWVSEPDRGQSHALNKGFARARGKWLGWLNSDDLLLPESLKRVVQAIDEQPDVRWWIGSGYFIHADGRFLRDYGAPPRIERPDELSDWRTKWFAQPSTFFHRSLWEEAGAAVREDLHYAMDLDLWLRYLAITPPGRIEHSLSVYRHHAEGKTEKISETGEVEIVRVLEEHLGIEGALPRVRALAKDRNDLVAKVGKYERLLAPLLWFLRIEPRWMKKLRAGKAPGWS